MKVVLATGIYPPEIGGPATYVRQLARVLVRKGVEVTVVTYSDFGHRTSDGSQSESRIPMSEPWDVVYVPKNGGFPMRWWRYAQALKKYAKGADIVYAFSSVSCGMPLAMARLKKCKKILRLGGDFLWERYTDGGGMLSLRDFYTSKPKMQWCMVKLLSMFDHIVFSTEFQKDIYEQHYSSLPEISVLENALVPDGMLRPHIEHAPFRILSLGRLVAFKNLSALILAMQNIEDAQLIIAGDGPMLGKLQELVSSSRLESRVYFVGAVHGEQKREMFLENDVLVIPSITEISPNAALEARSEGMPIILTKETGLSAELTNGMYIDNLSAPEQIVTALKNVRGSYARYAVESSEGLKGRSWERVAEEHIILFQNVMDNG